MEFLLLPFFFPLLLIGWVIDEPTAPGPRSERHRERLFRATWLPIHGSGADVASALRVRGR